MRQLSEKWAELILHVFSSPPTIPCPPTATAPLFQRSCHFNFRTSASKKRVCIFSGTWHTLQKSLGLRFVGSLGLRETTDTHFYHVAEIASKQFCQKNSSVIMFHLCVLTFCCASRHHRASWSTVESPYLRELLLPCLLAVWRDSLHW